MIRHSYEKAKTNQSEVWLENGDAIDRIQLWDKDNINSIWNSSEIYFIRLVSR